jgi:hypothetical protein
VQTEQTVGPGIKRIEKGGKQVNGLLDYDPVFVGFQGFGADAGDLNNILGDFESAVGLSKLNDALGIFGADAFKRRQLVHRRGIDVYLGWIVPYILRPDHGHQGNHESDDETKCKQPLHVRHADKPPFQYPPISLAGTYMAQKRLFVNDLFDLGRNFGPWGRRGWPLFSYVLI